jgi:SAM-dependent methyltransferase
MAATEAWSSGDEYERFIGRWSRLVAPRFVTWLEIPPSRRWLDVGTGTGALAAAVIATADPAEVVGIDASAAYVAEAARRVPDPRARFQVADASAVGAAREFDVAVSGLVVNFVADPERVVQGLLAAVVPGGTVAAYVWDYARGMALLRHFWDVAVELDPDAAALDEGVRFPLCRIDRLAACWAAAGAVGVETITLDVETTFASFDDLWQPFLGGQGPAPGYVATLAPPARDRLRDALADRLPVDEDGRIRLVARALAVRGRPPTP